MLLHLRRLLTHQRIIQSARLSGRRRAGEAGSARAQCTLQQLHRPQAAHYSAMAATQQGISSAEGHVQRMARSLEHPGRKRQPIDGPRCPSCNNPCRDADRVVQHMRKCCRDLLPTHLRVENTQERKRPKGVLNGQHAVFVAADPILDDEQLQQLLATAKQQEDELREKVLHLLYISDDWVPSGADSVMNGDSSSTGRLSSSVNSSDADGKGNVAKVGGCISGIASTSGAANGSSDRIIGNITAGVANSSDGCGESTSTVVVEGRQKGNSTVAVGRGIQPMHHGKGKRRKTPEELATVLSLPLKRVQDLLVRAPKAIPLAIDNDPLEILYEDQALLAVAKPPGVCSAPAHRFAGGTMVNRIAGYLGVAQPHVLHRLDMNTSGVLLVAKGVEAARNCHEQFEHKQVTKEYLALCIGGQRPVASTFSIDGAIGPHPHMQVARAVVEVGGQPALTHFEVLSSSKTAMPVSEGAAGEVSDASVLAASQGACLMRCRPVTGRTHQIRLHLAAAGHPLVGDEVYGVHQGPWIGRQALHAWQLTVQHPNGSGPITFSAPPPPDFVRAADHLGLDLAPLARNASGAGIA